MSRVTNGAVLFDIADGKRPQPKVDRISVSWKVVVRSFEREFLRRRTVQDTDAVNDRGCAKRIELRQWKIIT